MPIIPYRFPPWHFLYFLPLPRHSPRAYHGPPSYT